MSSMLQQDCISTGDAHTKLLQLVMCGWVEYGSPVAKKDGSMRMCVNYRALHKQTRKTDIHCRALMTYLTSCKVLLFFPVLICKVHSTKCGVNKKTSLNLGGGPTPGEGVQQCNAAEEHVVSLVATAKGGKVAAIRQGHCSVTIAWAGGFSFYLRGMLSPLPCLGI